MQWWLLALGILLLAAVALDLLWTVLWVQRGQGPLTARLTSWMWRGFRRLVPRGRDGVLSLAGPLASLVTILSWLLLLWGGWVLVFLAQPDALRSTTDGAPPDLAGTIYFVGYSLFTMGNGDFTPVGDASQLATALTTASGMMFVTLFISYVISVAGAVVAKRAFANQVHGLGETPADVLVRAWDGRGFPSLDLQVQSLNTQLAAVTEQHLAYPILHYYHPGSRDKSTALAVAKLDEALSLAAHAVAPGARLPPTIVHSGHSGTRTYLRTLEGAFIDPADDAPPPPSLEPLRRAGIPLADGSAFRDALLQHGDRRRLLLSAVEGDAWRWDDLGNQEPA